MNQSLSFALFRTYAVPSIGRLLDETGQFTGACQKRYDDTGLLLEAPLAHGFDDEHGRTAVRRINQMHKMYDISNDDFRYVLATFVVVPTRWIARFGYRPLTDTEVRASVAYYRDLGKHMAIRDVPETYEGFCELMDSYEREHFAYDDGARRVADSTLDLLASFYPGALDGPVRLFSYALMDPPLLAAFAYDEPGRLARRVSEAGLRLRAKALRLAPPRRTPSTVADSPRISSLAGGLPSVAQLAAMGTFPEEHGTPAGEAARCPVEHATA
ncbi:MAG: L-aspartate oxidase [Nocardioides sp.]|nr:L-aspartate oxidase [Nocardioides sp.]